MTTTNPKTSKTWTVLLWILQIALAGIFLMAGAIKTFTPIEELSGTLPMASELPFLTRFIGVCEILGSMGLVLPGMLRILPRLTIFAAYAFVAVMALAFLFHLQRQEYSAIITNLILGAVAFVIAWGRINKSPIQPRLKTANASN